MQRGKGLLLLAAFLTGAVFQPAVNADPAQEYRVGVNDILVIHVIQPDAKTEEVTVAPDGYIAFPYIGRLEVRGRTVSEIEAQITALLADGYLRYPVVSVVLKESRSRRFFVYGEVANPGAFSLDENMTVFKAIAVAGGFTKFGSSSKVKVMRPFKEGRGYELIKVDLSGIVNGVAEADIYLESGDVVVIAEGVF